MFPARLDRGDLGEARVGAGVDRVDELPTSCPHGIAAATPPGRTWSVAWAKVAGPRSKASGRELSAPVAITRGAGPPAAAG